MNEFDQAPEPAEMRSQRHTELMRHIRQNPIKTAYIVGASYSGSTLLTFALASHPDISTIGEADYVGRHPDTHDVGTYLCSCGSAIKNCRFWQSLDRQFRQLGIAVDDYRFQVTNSTLASQNRWGRRASKIRSILHPDPMLERSALLAYFVMQAQAGLCFLNGTKSATMALSYLRSSWFDTFVIHLTRNGYGQVASRIRHGGDSVIDSAAARLAKKDRQCRLIRTLFGKRRYLHVRYEDFCADPRHELQRIAGFLQLDPEKFPRELLPRDHHVVGNQMRLSIGDSLDIRLDEKWRKTLTAGQLDRISGEIDRRNRIYGYPGRAEIWHKG